MAIAGIEGLAQGFMQGMALKRQNDRQDVLDAQNLERFSMDKERFATQQAASAFELQNAQTNAANAATDRTRTLAIQAKGDAFHDGMSKIVGAFENGDMNGGYKALEQTTNTTGIGKGRFKSDASGNVMLDAKGNATWENLDANGNVVGKPVITDHKSAFDRIANAFNPEKYHDRQVATAAEITKEERAAKTAATVAATLHSYRMSEKAQELLAAKLARAEAKDAELDAKDITTLFSVPITVTDADGKIKISQQVNQKQVTDYMKWTKKNKVRMTPTTFRDWRAEIPSSGTTDTTTSGTDTYDSKSQGKLVAKGISKEAGEIQVDAPPLVLGGQGAVPKSLTIPRPVPTVSYENMPIKSVTKTAVKQGRGGGSYTYQEVLATRDMPIPPEGFKRKSLSERDPNFNVFVSNNYQD